MATTGNDKIEALQDSPAKKFSAWELEFIESLEGQDYEDLTAKQQTKVDELYEKVQ